MYNFGVFNLMSQLKNKFIKLIVNLKFGRCPKCMRVSIEIFLLTLIIYLIAKQMGLSLSMTLFVVTLIFGVLSAIHITMYVFRIRLVAREAAKKHPQLFSISRRQLIKFIVSSTLFTLLPFLGRFPISHASSEELPRERELKGEARRKAIGEALSNNEVKALIKYLNEQGYKRYFNSAQSIMLERGDEKALVVILPFSGDKVAQVNYLRMNNIKGATAFIMDAGGNIHTILKVQEGQIVLKELSSHCCSVKGVCQCVETILGHCSAACVIACISCLGSAFPGCLVCSFCAGLYSGCAIGCCLF